jgi:hydroxymethylpyrimidine/phosphomethylpyrimidine kinase
MSYGYEIQWHKRFREDRVKLGGYEQRFCSRKKKDGTSCTQSALPWLYIETCHAHASELEQAINAANEAAAKGIHYAGRTVKCPWPLNEEALIERYKRRKRVRV